MRYVDSDDKALATWRLIDRLAAELDVKRNPPLPPSAQFAAMNQCKGCACFTDDSHGGLVNGLCLDCRNPEVDPFPVDPDKPYGDTL